MSDGDRRPAGSRGASRAGRGTAATRSGEPRSIARTGDAALSGILIVGKPAGPTSHDVVAVVRRLTGVRRVGHGGTLDPFATGVLPVFVGPATRMVEYHLGDAKAYRALVCFGARSTTDDLEGELTPGDGPAPDRPAVEQALPRFLGRIRQRPPDYSAVKVAGRRAYDVARHGGRPEVREREVEITALDLLAWDDADPARPTAVLDVHCSAGTYVRSIARDLGDALGCGAYLGSLTRTASGPFTLERATPLDELRALLGEGRAAERLLPPDAGLDAYPAVSLAPEDLDAIVRGQVVRAPSGAREAGPDDVVRILDATGGLVAMGRLRAARIHPDKVLVGLTA